MKRLIAALVAALSPGLAVAQGMSHPHHGQPGSPPASTGSQPASAKAAAPAAPHAAASLYRSPFAGYRAFSEEVPPKDWRKANDEVREAGGHIGLMKAQPAQLQGHGAHGAKQPAPPASGERK